MAAIVSWSLLRVLEDDRGVEHDAALDLVGVVDARRAAPPRGCSLPPSDSPRSRMTSAATPRRGGRRDPGARRGSAARLGRAGVGLAAEQLRLGVLARLISRAPDALLQRLDLGQLLAGHEAVELAERDQVHEVQAPGQRRLLEPLELERPVDLHVHRLHVAGAREGLDGQHVADPHPVELQRRGQLAVEEVVALRRSSASSVWKNAASSLPTSVSWLPSSRCSLARKSAVLAASSWSRISRTCDGVLLHQALQIARRWRSSRLRFLAPP